MQVHRARRWASNERRGRSAHGARGAALVEFALIAPVLFLILAGIIEFGVSLNDYQSVRHGVREGARQAAVQQYGSASTSCTTATAPDDVKKVICLTKDRIGLGSNVRVRVEYTKATGSGGDFGSISVCAQRKVVPFTRAVPGIDGISLKSSIEMRMEDALPSTIVFPAATASQPNPPAVYAETLEAGQDWTGC